MRKWKYEAATDLNIPAGERMQSIRREKGMASFAYAEFLDFPGFTTNRLVRTWMPGKSDGLTMTNAAPLEWHLGYRGKTVVFHLHRLRQEPPAKFTLGKDEQFVMRTFDESGYQFFLLFHRERPFFFWVLNEEETVPDTFEPVFEGFEAGRRSGFVFWVDRDHGNRRVLVAVRRASSVRNDYYDGPFDQLADNDADQTQVAEYIQDMVSQLAIMARQAGLPRTSERLLSACSVLETEF